DFGIGAVAVAITISTHHDPGMQALQADRAVLYNFTQLIPTTLMWPRGPDIPMGRSAGADQFFREILAYGNRKKGERFTSDASSPSEATSRVDLCGARRIIGIAGRNDALGRACGIILRIIHPLARILLG